MALVINRRKGESVRIGDAEVHIINTTRTHVCLAIVAPRTTKILRMELDDRERPTEQAASE